MRARRFATALTFGCAMLLAACQLLLGVEDEKGAARPPVIVGDDGGDADVASGCQLAHPPSAPAAKDGGPPQTIFFAAQTFRVSPSGAPRIGYDLDDRCTDTETPPADLACSGSGSGTAAVDGPGGIDNALGWFSEQMSEFFKSQDAGPDPFAKQFTSYATIGYRTLHISLALYNGEANDDEVTVSVRASGPFLRSGCAGAGAPDAACLNGVADAGCAPQWDGCDQWSYVGIPVPSRAWVRDNVLVARIDDLHLPLGDVEISLKDAVVTARLDLTDGAKRRLTGGILAGRASAAELVSGVLGTTDSNDKSYCNDPTVRATVTSLLCGARDIRATKSLDGTGACDAISVGLGFDAVEAQFPTPGIAIPPGGCPAALEAGCQ
jgi:hypothetical protein